MTQHPNQENTKAGFNLADNKGCSLTIIFVLAIALALLAYFLGKKNGSVTIDNIATNNTFIKEVAELASLEANGVASIKSTNIANDGSFTDAMRKLFLEKTVNITVPYTAKYGVDLEKQNLIIQEKDKTVTIELPNPTLLSYELRLDKMDAITRNGLLQSMDENSYNNLEKKLYSQSRAQLEQNQAYIQRAKEKIKKLLEAYYEPMKLKAEVLFSEKLNNKPINKLD